jgi:hypothetical protein
VLLFESLILDLTLGYFLLNWFGDFFQGIIGLFYHFFGFLIKCPRELVLKVIFIRLLGFVFIDKFVFTLELVNHSVEELSCDQSSFGIKICRFRQRSRLHNIRY